MKRIAPAAFVVGLMASAALAGPVEDREAYMKQNGGFLGQLMPISRGQQEFNADEVMKILKDYAAHAEMLDVAAMFPAGTEGAPGTKNRAAPAIWSNADDFAAEVAKYKENAAKAAAATPQSAEELGAIVGMIGGDCRSCHQTYRLPES